MSILNIINQQIKKFLIAQLQAQGLLDWHEAEGLDSIHQTEDL